MSIRRRIINGYIVVLGVAFLGIAMGLLIGNSKQQQALELRQAAINESKQLNALRINILQNHPTQQFTANLDDLEQFELAKTKFFDGLVEVEKIINSYREIHDLYVELNIEASLAPSSKSAADRHTEHSEMEHHDHDEYYEFHQLIQDYRDVVVAFRQKADIFFQEIEPLISGSPGDILIAEQKIIDFSQSQEFKTFIDFADQLQPYVQQVDVRKRNAELQSLRSTHLRNRIIIGSLLTSILIALGIAIYTSQAIAQPILKIIQTAQQVTNEKDFSLQIAQPEIDGEVRTLATSINALITQVQLLLEQLEAKNVDLEDALNQLHKQQAKLVQSEKMSSLGKLVAGVAHEINNPVNFIHGNLYHAQSYAQDLLSLLDAYQAHFPDIPPDLEDKIEDSDLSFLREDFPKTLESMGLGTERIRGIVLSLRNFSRTDEAEFKTVDVHEGIESTLLILQHRLKEHHDRPKIEVIRNYAELPRVDCFPGQLNQVFMNLFSNGIDAIEDQHMAQQQQGMTDYVGQFMVRTELVDAEWVSICIKDNGKGVPLNQLSRIFDPFFTTKAIGKGTGMGLSISYQIIAENHGGELSCISTLGLGSEFVIRLPLRQKHKSSKARVVAAAITSPRPV
ncbi:MAG: HAMP domain-containing histidine kinase [Limnothrix sp. RL_2_0]|nr:HAMP domain-containing histidine kinase [Limnothrix sp. RL_2_0]